MHSLARRACMSFFAAGVIITVHPLDEVCHQVAETKLDLGTRVAPGYHGADCSVVRRERDDVGHPVYRSPHLVIPAAAYDDASVIADRQDADTLSVLVECLISMAVLPSDGAEAPAIAAGISSGPGRLAPCRRRAVGLRPGRALPALALPVDAPRWPLNPPAGKKTLGFRALIARGIRMGLRNVRGATR
jgi:hypothetical protein